MKEHDGDKNWASQYHPSGRVDVREGLFDKWWLNIFKAAIVFIVFVGVVGLIWWMV